MRDSCSFYETVRRWVNKFKRSRTSIEDTLRPGTANSALTPENIDKLHDIVLVDRRVKVRELAETMGISMDRVHFILHHELHMKNCAHDGCRICSL